MLSPNPGKQLYTIPEDYVVFDLETTGLSSANDAVVEISAIKVLGGQPCYEFSTLVNPERHIPYGASSVNNITDAMVAHAPLFEEAFSAFLDFVGDLTLVGHNIAAFDMRFLYRYAEEYWGLTVGNDFADTRNIGRRLVKLPSYTLEAMATHYGIAYEGAHRALADCDMTRRVFEHLREELQAAPASGERRCPRCGSLLKLRNGRFGEFYGCMGYPDCRYTEPVTPENEKVHSRIPKKK